MAKIVVRLRGNGADYDVFTEPSIPVLDVVRAQLGLQGAKEGCGTGDCGACSMLFDGNPFTSYLMIVPDAEGHEITTIEGLGHHGAMHPVQKASAESGALSCGLVHPRPDYLGGRTPGSELESDVRGNPVCSFRESLPMHWLYQTVWGH
jgi:aerobic carbon-monoxide dehydrogenase small subunit